MLADFRPQIRADLLSEYGVDLAEWVAARRFRGLLDLIDGLPSTSRFYEAMVNHDDYAAEIAALPEPTDPWSPRVADYGLTEVILARISDKLDGVITAVVSTAGGKPPDPKPFPSPKTAVDKLRAQAELDWATDFIQQLGFSPEDI